MANQFPGFFAGTEMPNAGWWEALWPDPAAVLAAVGVKPDMAVMDLCSGDGWFTLPIAKLARHVVAIDIDTDLLDAARHRLTESGVTNCDFVAGNAYELTRLWPQPVDRAARPVGRAARSLRLDDRARGRRTRGRAEGG